MAVETDERAGLPDPPPPRPAQRDAAIESALRRFEGIEDRQRHTSKPPRTEWGRRNRTQLAVLVSAVLLFIVGVPAALIGIRNAPQRTHEQIEVPAREDRCAGGACKHETVAQHLPTVGTETQPPSSTVPSGSPLPARKYSGGTGADVTGADVAKTQQQAEPAIAAPSTATSEAPVTAAAPPPPPPPPPPAPPPVASNAAGTSADTFVVTGSRIPNPMAATPGRPAAKARQAPEAKRGGAVDSAAYRDFLSRLQAAVGAGDRHAVIALIDLPLRVNFAGGSRMYSDPQSVDRDFDRIFTRRVRQAILSQRADRLFVRDQGAMIGNGEIWFSETCASPDCSKVGPVRIRSVNP